MFKRLIGLLLLLCLLTGCATAPSPATEPAATAEPTAFSTEPTEVVIPETVELQAVNVHSFRKSKEKPSVAILDHRTAAFLTGEYPNNDFSKKHTRIQIVDLYADILIRDTLLEGAYTARNCSGDIGCFAAVGETGNILILDRNLQEILSFTPQNPDGILTADLTQYYYVWGSELYCLDTATGETQPVDGSGELSYYEILDYDARENILLFSAYVGIYGTEMCVVAMDLDTMEYRLLYRGVTDGRLADSGILLELARTEERTADLYYGDWPDSQMKLLPAFLDNDLDSAAWHIPGSDYVCRFTYDPNTKVDIVDFELFLLQETVTAASLQEQLDGAKITQIFSLPDGNLLAMEAGSRGYRTYLILPEQLDFAEVEPEMTQGETLVDLTILEENTDEAPWDLPEELAQVRQQADELEEKYDVTILISGECAPALKGAGMEIVTTDQARLRDEAGSIADALQDMDEMFALYPEDFFSQFRDEAGEHGLLVLLVEHFEDERNVIGLSWGMGKWYPIAIDITSGEVASTYCHELWHATEFRVQTLNQVALDLAAWDNCNPAGYLYSGNMTPSYILDTQYTYLYGDSGEPVYFVDPYAKVNAYEDRARLMEYVMYREHDARMMLEHPAMAAKLQILCDAVRKAFDTSNWENVHWERFS